MCGSPTIVTATAVEHDLGEGILTVEMNYCLVNVNAKQATRKLIS